ncbi:MULTISPECIES: hypothetical protein [unclassified Mesorhizobium]|uniref:hypothetical protein n=1 Tax=unclassified Mesorhizobium TaxID=325217 RepID=UPI000FCC345C|nr:MULTISPECIES: hypothetical protein [unclassified Mesorhizobium]RUW78276.1 hypothetical protein EOA31_02260 [Mesorhizobium sp. M4B.F.Ca.ET.049.02.1.2]RUX03904.1 hypothetical protein EOA35_11325 [Mesorhizobium sp. M8A.F.Ca.ET.023.01.1.1]RVD55934.1 hypothetical protein EN746_05395 [Mesorhizobium sp. M8A.F.Ca.ET.023.02.2.1]TGR36928.1 hypothetical protein EN842_52170 [bacterium M00.F.Ca.ET.199.01.1.1]TGU17885.1 hypothetical protein EN799_62140 [bacterium M00.F.Ca.ET.156.01.1.1]TGV82105.1 hypoth
MTAPIPLDDMSEKALARVAVPHMSRYKMGMRSMMAEVQRSANHLSWFHSALMSSRPSRVRDF